MKRIIVEKIYLSEEGALKYAEDVTELSKNEVEDVVGRFKASHSSFPQKLRGQLYIYSDGSSRIVHHFTKKTLWTNVGEERYS